MASGSCLEYSLRVACLQVLTEQRANLPRDRPQPVASTSYSTPTTTPSRRSHHDGGPSSFFAFDLSSLVGRDSSRSPKYPEKLLKVMDGTLQRIAMGQEAKFSDQRFRRTAALFWSSTWPDKAFQRQMRESRKIEDLILPFVTTATKALKKEEELADGAWKYELNGQIALFLDLLADSLHALGPIPAELATRLENYRTRVKAPDPPASSDRGSSDRGHGERGDADSVRSGKSVRREMPDGLRARETEGVAQLFGMNEEDLDQRLRHLQGICTQQAALEDLKTCLKRLNSDLPFPYSPDDFSDPSQWTTWRAGEVSTLSQMMLLMMQANPTLVQSSDRPSNGDLAPRLDGLKLDAPLTQFTFIPPDPLDTYRDLLGVCLDWDLEVLKTLPEDEDVSLGVLSQEHVAFLGECAVRWRLAPSFRAWVFLEAIVERCEQGLVPTACVHEAKAMIQKAQTEMPTATWTTSDLDGLERTIIRRDVCLLTAVATALEYGEGGYQSADFLDAVSDWLVLDVQDTRHPSLDAAGRNIVERVKTQAFQSYIQEASDRLDHEGSKTKGFALGLAGWIEKEAKKLNKKFGDPITEKVDLVPVVLQQHLTLWFRDMEDAMATPLLPGQDLESHLEQAFELYRRAQKLIDMGNAFSTEPVDFSIAPIFEGVVRQWLDQTATKTRQWADQALAVDSFEPTSEGGPSSSVTDLFDSFRSASEFIKELRWPDERQLACFSTRLAKVFSLSINDYCGKIEQLFANDMTQEETSQPAQTAAKQKAWIEKARSTIASLQGEKKIQAFFNFTPAVCASVSNWEEANLRSKSCVKLNNIEAARQQLDRLYQDMRVDDLAAYDGSEPIPLPEHLNYLFTVKIVLAEDLTLEGAGKLPDSFVIISDEQGNRYAKTRTIYDETDPRWDETFDIPLRGNAWFMATVRHRSLTGKHDLLGRAYLRLDPKQHLDLISRDVLLPLDTRGHLLLRISMEGERDDIQFHFGRAFRWLKRTESDMVRTFVDKMTPVLRSTLSRASIKSVLKPGGNPLDYNDAIGKLSAAYRSVDCNDALGKLRAVDYNEALEKLTSAYRNAIGSPEYTIPLPASEQRALPPPPTSTTIYSQTTVAPARKRGPTEAEIEAAIHPLFDYLDANNHTLTSTLSRDAMQSVMAKLWKQILMTIEGLIVPPLSDKPSLMRALSDGELDVALKWLKFLRDFFYVGGDSSGVPLSTLQNAKFNEILSVRIYYDWKTDDLMEECIRGFQSTLKYKATKPSKSLVSQRNLGTIRARKSAKRAQPSGGGNTEMIMRILRMRQGTQEFLAQQIQTISVVKLENPKKGRSLNRAR